MSDKTNTQELPYCEPYKIKMTEAIRTSTRAEREQWIKDAQYNLFKLRADQTMIDLLTDSGVGSMSDRQWSALMTGDESYAGAKSYYHLRDAVQNIFGMPWFLPTHQGRAAENVIFSVLLKEGDIVPGNSHFDTTKGHIEYRRAVAIDCTIDAAADTQAELPFKGEMDLGKLEEVLKKYPKEKIPCCVLTVTNNTAGGQPVSMKNIRETTELCHKYGIPVLMDSARFAQNAYFIKMREKGYENKSIKEIVREMYAAADMMTISAKKDGVVNMGGFVAMRSEDLFRRAMQFNIMYEGYITYGGMSGRDMEALAVGLDENTEFDQLDARVRQVAFLGAELDKYGIPYQRPAGGHAIFLDAKKILPNLPKEQFIAQTLGIELYLEAGIRGVEIGSILADRDPVTRENRYPRLELLRLAIPCRTYTDNHMRVIAAACKNVYDRRESITRGYKITFEAPIMRHFTAELEKA
ncbi:MAG: tryptophanase [Alistipes sp.]|jgi:tryptophanase|nr:tryptophanase [Alistipes sp.]